MASLNTLRTKYGIVLSAVIAIALLAFILTLKPEMGMSGSDPVVGVIADHEVLYSEYMMERNDLQAQSGNTGSSEQEATMLSNNVWQMLFAKYVLVPGFEEAALSVGDKERMSIISGEYPSQVLYNLFTDPATGQYSVAAVQNFVLQAETNPQMASMWASLNEQIRLERESTKFSSLVARGVYVNKLELEDGVDAANNTFSGRWISKSYSSIPDSVVNVSDSEIKSYYNAHKKSFKQTPLRSINYVMFDVEPTSEDLLAIENTAQSVGAEFAAADDVRRFVRANRNGSVAESFVTASMLPADEAEALMAGEQYGPVMKNNAWTMSRVVESKMLPDSIGLRHIVLPYTETVLADSLVNVIEGGADFASVAAQYSQFQQTAANGGDLGVIPFSVLQGEFVEKLSDAKRGDVVLIASGDALQIMQAYRVDRPTKHVQVATITYPLEASSQTRTDIHSQANTFASSMNGGGVSFADASSEIAMTPRIASIPQGQRTLPGVDDSREIVIWAHGAEVGDVSDIFKVGDNYVVATLTEIDDNKIIPVEKVAAQIRSILRRNKKYDMIKAEISGSTIEEQANSLGAEVANFENVNYASFYIDGMGVEPRVVGAITSTEQSATPSTAVKGMNAAYVFVVDAVEKGTAQTLEAERVRAQAVLENIASQLSFSAMQELSEIEDLRGQYF